MILQCNTNTSAWHKIVQKRVTWTWKGVGPESDLDLEISGKIPPDSTLLFDTELVDVKPSVALE